MAPKRSAKMVVKTTKKVVKETIEVSVLGRSKRRQSGDGDDDQEERLKPISIETEEANQVQNVEISVEKEPLSIPIGTQGEEMEETPITPDQKEASKRDDQRSEEMKAQDGEKDKEEEDSMETFVTANQIQDEDEQEDDEEEEESSKKQDPTSEAVRTQEGEKSREQGYPMETNITSDQNQDSEQESMEKEDPKTQENEEEREDSTEADVTSDEIEEGEEEEEASRKEKLKSEEVKSREGAESQEKRGSVDAKTTCFKKTEEKSRVKSRKGGAERSEKKRKRKKSREGGKEYKRYLYRVLKQVHPGMGASSKVMVVLNSLMNDMFEQVAAEAAKLTAYSKQKTMSSREIQGAVKLVLPGELGIHAMAEGTKAVSAYVSSNEGGSKA